MSDPSYHYFFKFITIGETSTGKSAIISRLKNGKFNKIYNPTIGVEFASKVVEIDGLRIKVQIWDTAGQEKFQSVTKNYYRQSIGCLLVFDICDQKSFKRARDFWLKELLHLSPEEVGIVLVGNKTDRASERTVTEEEGKELARDNGLLYVETSALDGSNIEETFKMLAKSIVEKIKKKQIVPNYNNDNLGVRAGNLLVEDEIGIGRGNVDEGDKKGDCKC